jgi:DNA-binding MarR family transcriptional regulator
MTSNEKKVLEKFKEIGQGNTVTMAGTLRVTISYAYDVCKKLCEKGYLERLSPGRFASYRITSLGEKQVGTVVQANANEEANIERYECVSCGAGVKEDDTECPKCGIIFDEAVEEEAVKSLDSSPDRPCKQAPQPVPSSSAILGINPV